MAQTQIMVMGLLNRHPEAAFGEGLERGSQKKHSAARTGCGTFHPGNGWGACQQLALR